MNKKREVIYGPPGTGKSTELVRKVNLLIEKGIPAYRIGICSFTKAAAEVLLSKAKIKTSHTGTIHGLCFRICELSRDEVVGTTDLIAFGNQINMKFNFKNEEIDTTEKQTVGDVFLRLTNLAKANGVTDKEGLMLFFENHNLPVGSKEGFASFVWVYEEWKRITGKIDYTDMLLLALDKPAPKLEALFVDEAQDLSPLQWKVIYHWANSTPYVCICGDDDQTIYKFSGADPSFMYDFEKNEKAEKTVLSQSFRIPKSVHRVAKRLTEEMGTRVTKEYDPRPEEGVVSSFECFSDIHRENPIVHGQDIFILVRNHKYRAEAEAFLMDNNIPYTAEGGRPSPLQYLICKYINLLNGLKLGSTQPEDISKATLAKMMSSMHDMYRKRFVAKDLSFVGQVPWNFVFQIPKDVENYLLAVHREYGVHVVPTIKISTIHNSKGKEADRVILFNRMSKDMQKDLENEARVFYVGVTRARHRLDIVHGDVRMVGLYT